MVTYDGFDVVAPKQLILPTNVSGAIAAPITTGSIWISGAKLYFNNGTAAVLITSA